jgi:hypothetical protein
VEIALAIGLLMEALPSARGELDPEPDMAADQEAPEGRGCQEEEGHDHDEDDHELNAEDINHATPPFVRIEWISLFAMAIFPFPSECRMTAESSQ